MARHHGSGVASIEYPTGMNQAGDPSQAWITLKPDGHVDVFTGTCDLGQGSRTVHAQIAADTIGVPYDWPRSSASRRRRRRRAPAPEGYLEALSELCHRHEVLL